MHAECDASGDSDRGFATLIGAQSGLREAAQTARLLMKVDAPVLLQGETGVGKEVFARAIHDSVPIASHPFVAVNCGGLPRDLLASELFGYVDGAFTGARRSGMVGKIESAANHIIVKPCVLPSEIKQRIEQALIRSVQTDAQRIQVEVQGSRVILKGTVRSWAENEKAERAAWRAPGVGAVENQIQVSFY